MPMTTYTIRQRDYEPADWEILRKEVWRWVEEVLGEKLDNFENALSDGVVLCRLLNAIRPNAIPMYKIKIGNPPLMYKMENITVFLNAVETLDIQKALLFDPKILASPKPGKNDFKQVLKLLFWLGKIAKSLTYYKGPQLDTSILEIRCGICQKPIMNNQGTRLYGAESYHAACLCCVVCWKSLDPSALVSPQERPVCQKCASLGLGAADSTRPAPTGGAGTDEALRSRPTSAELGPPPVPLLSSGGLMPEPGEASILGRSVEVMMIGDTPLGSPVGSFSAPQTPADSPASHFKANGFQNAKADNVSEMEEEKEKRDLRSKLFVDVAAAAGDTLSSNESSPRTTSPIMPLAEVPSFLPHGLRASSEILATDMDLQPVVSSAELRSSMVIMADPHHTNAAGTLMPPIGENDEPMVVHHSALPSTSPIVVTSFGGRSGRTIQEETADTEEERRQPTQAALGARAAFPGRKTPPPFAIPGGGEEEEEARRTAVPTFSPFGAPRLQNMRSAPVMNVSSPLVYSPARNSPNVPLHNSTFSPLLNPGMVSSPSMARAGSMPYYMYATPSSSASPVAGGIEFITALLQEVGLDKEKAMQYAEALATEDITDLDSLLGVSDNTLKSLGLSYGVIGKLRSKYVASPMMGVPSFHGSGLVHSINQPRSNLGPAMSHSSPLLSKARSDIGAATQQITSSLPGGLVSSTAANQMAVSDQMKVKQMYDNHQGIFADDQQTYEYYFDFAHHDDLLAQTVLGWMYSDGRAVPKDKKKASEWFQVAAEKGFAAAQNSLGIRYKTGEGVTQDLYRAMVWFTKSADQGFAPAQYNLALAYEMGRGVRKDDKKAADYYGRAAEQGVVIAMAKLGAIHAQGRGVPLDDRKAVDYYLKAAYLGNGDAQNNLAFMYQEGRGVLQDDEKAAEWYLKAGEQGLAVAQRNIANFYQKGRGVPKDQQKAVFWYKKAAEKGDADALYNLGEIYEEDSGVVERAASREFYCRAAECYRKAGYEYSDPHAQVVLASMYERGKGIVKNDRKAVKWYKMAAAQGNTFALAKLGRSSLMSASTSSPSLS